MILTTNYVLVNEVAEANNVGIGNFSYIPQQDLYTEGADYIKSGNILVIDKTCQNWPKNVKSWVDPKFDYTDLDGLTPSSFFYEMGVKRSDLPKLGETINVSGKVFIDTNKAVKTKLKTNQTLSLIEEHEKDEDYAVDLIPESILLSNGYLVSY